jgi:hypothetical protein
MIVGNNTQLYETCLTFLEAAVERDGEQTERANFWAGIAAKYAPPLNKQNQTK